MLSVSGSPAWRTVTGGSRRYVELAAKRLPDIRLSTPVRAVRRYPDHAELRDAACETHRFDAVVIAAHADQALRLLDPPTDAERDVLGAFTYTQNPALLHTDVTLLPRRPAVRASWNYQLSRCEPDARCAAHQLRHEPAAEPAGGEHYIVTLGGAGLVDPALVIDRMDYAHPAYTPASVAAQRPLPGLNTNVTAFAGAYHGWGFYEDGCRSGAAAAPVPRWHLVTPCTNCREPPRAHRPAAQRVPPPQLPVAGRRGSPASHPPLLAVLPRPRSPRRPAPRHPGEPRPLPDRERHRPTPHRRPDDRPADDRVPAGGTPTTSPGPAASSPSPPKRAPRRNAAASVPPEGA